MQALTKLMVAALAAAACACSSKSEPSPSATAGPATTSSVGLGFVPDSIGNHLASAGMIIAVDLRDAGIAPIIDALPMKIGCAAELVNKAGVIVATDDDPFAVYISNLHASELRRCLADILPKIGRSLDGFELSDDDGVVVGRPSGTHGHLGGPPSAAMRARAELVPSDVRGFFLMAPTAEQSLDVTAWLRVNDGIAEIVIRARGDRPGEAKAGLDEIATIIKSAAMGETMAVDDSWFTQTATELESTETIRLPLDALRKQP